MAKNWVYNEMGQRRNFVSKHLHFCGLYHMPVGGVKNFLRFECYRCNNRVRKNPCIDLAILYNLICGDCIPEAVTGSARNPIAPKPKPKGNKMLLLLKVIFAIASVAFVLLAREVKTNGNRDIY